MELLKTVSELQIILSFERKADRSIGFVPTMGALHAGHLALVKQSMKDNDKTVVSIFVNPTQFNNANDLAQYPRTLEMDCKLLEETGVDVVFVPSVAEIYPEPDLRQFDFGPLDKIMEGKFRPGHFNGVAQVVSRLFDIVKPDRAYFGKKDYQQVAIIRAMVRQLDLPVDIIPHPIIREPDGLAMSSRNARLSPEQRKNAVAISQTLFESQKLKHQWTASRLRREVTNRLNRVPGLQVEYFELVDGHSLQPIQSWKDSEYVVGCIAVYAGDVRLIDNVIY